MEMYKYIKCHSTLNPKLWNGFELKPEVKDKLMEIAKNFIDYIEQSVVLHVVDIVLVGSNVNYNYNKDSDIDLHVVVKQCAYDGEKCKDNEDMSEVYDLLRGMFNSSYNISIYGIPVELYIEETNNSSTNVSNGKYSLYYGWIKKPKKMEIELDIKSINNLYNQLVDEFNSLKEKISLEKYSYQFNELDKLLSKIYSIRKESLHKEGEFGVGNIVFKELRANGYIETIKSLKQKIFEKMMSIK